MDSNPGGAVRQRLLQQIVEASGVGFGTSGARGLVSQLDHPVCSAYASAFLAVMSRDHAFRSVALGMDLRPSSPRIAASCAAAIRAAGFEVDFCGVLPTPALALHAMARGVPAIMVTGSHIPFDRNGLKFYRPDGEISKADESAMLAAPVPAAAPAAVELPRPGRAAADAYVDRYLSCFSADALAGLRIGFYEHSSASREVLATILLGLGAEVVSLGRTDEFVPIDTEAVSAADMARGRAWAAEHRLDALVSTDGDGDRPLLSDEQGNWLRGDLVGLLCAQALKIDALAVPVSCNTAIEATGDFIRVARTRIGSPHVIASMSGLAGAHARVAGFEANGGFLLGCALDGRHGTLAPLPTRDAALPALAVLASAREAGVPVSALLERLPSRHTASDRLQDFPGGESRRLVARWTAAPEELLEAAGLEGAATSLDTTDGLRITLSDGRVVHLRPSGNAPELRCYAEAGSPAEAAALVDTVLRFIGGRTRLPA
jgi:phosphomannomutase